jgi:LmbE family N-acetylglucosaminyl deacetylase
MSEASERLPGMAAPGRAMVIVSHPDDAEFICAGTVARWAAGGSHIIFVLGTSGDKGSDDPNMSTDNLIETREAEQREAARILGVKDVEFLRYRDAELEPNLDLRLALTRMIRKHRPDAVICQDPTERWVGQEYIQHPDHLAMGEASLAAIFPSARDRLTFPQLIAEGLEPHKVTEVYLAGAVDSDIWIDITDYFDTKIEALAAHKSQMGDWDFASMLRRWARDSAAEARFKRYPHSDDMELAESFKYFKLD